LFDANDPRSIAETIVSAIENRNLRQSAAGVNQQMILARADYEQTMKRVDEFYEKVVRSVSKQVVD
jgi:hypothetical protein